MPDHPERDIERQLRASAEQRRTEASAPFELHEATRRLLQDEVVRQYGKPKDRPDAARSWWLALWPRFAVGTALAAMLGVCVWLALPPNSPQETLAMGGAAKEKDASYARDQQPATVTPSARPAELVEQSAQPALRLEPALTLASSGDEGRKADDPIKLELGDKKLPQDLPPATAAVTLARLPESVEIASAKQKLGEEATPNETLAQPRGGVGRAGGGGFGGAVRSRPTGPQRDLANPGSASNKEANEPATVLESTKAAFANNGAVTGELASLARPEAARANQNLEPGAWYFRNQVVPPEGRTDAFSGGRGGRGVAPAPATSAPITRAVLNSFRVEQSGDDMRIVDEDGSVYTGKLQTEMARDGSLVTRRFASALEETESTRGARSTAESRAANSLQQFVPVNFNVSGLNRSLSQQVVFTGQWQQVVLRNAVSNQTGARFLAAQTSVTAPQSNSALTQSQSPFALNLNLQQRIVGQVRLQDARELKVDALNIPPSK